MKKVLTLVMLAFTLFTVCNGQSKSSQMLLLNDLSGEVENGIADLLEEINSDSIASYIQTLQNYGTRFEIAENHASVGEWVFNKFKSFGYSDVQYDEFNSQISFMDYDSLYTLRSIICSIPGYGAPEEEFIMCAHYDSFCSNINPMETAPGADDNASGTAALLEIARVLKLNNFSPKRTIHFAALDGEELMNSAHSGSANYAGELFARNADVKLVMNHDMIGYTDKPLEQSFVNINRHDNSEHYANLAINTIVSETVISAQHAQYWGADLRPFTYYGYNGIYFEETVFSPFYHTNVDLFENMDIAYCTEVIKGSCATLVRATSMPNYVEGINAVLVSGTTNSVRFSWQANNDFDFDTYMFYYSENEGDSFSATPVTDTTIVVENISDFEKVRYAIAVLSTDGYESFASLNELNVTSIKDDNGLRNEFLLSQNYPNPFNPSTIIEYSIPKSSFVALAVYDVLGNKVCDLVSEYKSEGNYKINFNAEHLSSGIYFYHLASGEFLDSKKMILVK